MTNSILKSLIRTYFFDLCVETFFSGLWKNMVVPPFEKQYQMTEEGLLEAVKDGEFKKYGLDLDYDAVVEAIQDNGIEAVWLEVIFQINMSGRAGSGDYDWPDEDDDDHL